LFRLEPLATAAVAGVLKSALVDSERGLGARRVTAEEKILADLAVLCDGDLRRALNALEVLVLGLDEGAAITAAELEIFARERRIRYDADEDEHYDTISAFIKSCRGSDPDAAMYWLAKMLAGGEDPRFIARRLVILASEDVGLADPQALPLTVAAHHACDFIGLPEAELTLAHATLYIATAPKSNSATLALGEAHRVLKEQPVQAGAAAVARQERQGEQGERSRQRLPLLARLSGEHFRAELSGETAGALHAEDGGVGGEDRGPVGAVAGTAGAGVNCVRKGGPQARRPQPGLARTRPRAILRT
jgi:putative ATPase